MFICWFSHDEDVPDMSDNRFRALKTLVDNIGVPVIMITNNNLQSFVKSDYPLHEGFKYLTGNHKSDYLRSYLLHHYGGGYHDIKFRTSSWDDQWDKFINNDTWIVGRKEYKERWIGYSPGMKHIQKEHNKLVTMGWIICRPYTKYTYSLSKALEATLDKHLPSLIKYPAQIPRGYYPDKPYEPVPPNSYPLRWLEMMGEKSHEIMLKYTSNICFGLPDVVYKNYK